ncbi:CRISPR-associated protein, Csd1 family [Geosporobacter subterraneus DSM 17957]|uniref:CRISPR-associated protein, Csd1 family n=1 Tax=Geosporobacter subterraneus DSM 17957 TaxID=1121919 RepID=A0A1M6F189_9FIRM|nr:type I-C CRISPR-associated protein Cas8c/Csd1 [Geosporobacter subterraneus]SHI91447.1 CRISPR-associated protein, Csd1 family [Geosporobacter subterraneus DSM 17957]
MILQSLVNYYEILASDADSDIPRLGYGKANVSYAVNLSADGELLNIIPLKINVQKGKKLVEVPQSMEVPEQEKKSVGIKSNFLCENSSYMFGIDNKGKPERSKECFKAFKELHINILQNINNAAAKAVISFVNNWDIDQGLEHPALQEYLDEILSGANLVFKMDGGEFVHQNKEIRQIWEKHKSSSENTNVMQCLVTGKEETIARLHPSIKGVKGAQSVGGSIVSFNDRAYESYGRYKEQGLNSPVSEYATFAYTTVLNYLLADGSHKMYLGDATIVFWAESPKKIYQDFMSLYMNGGMVNNDERMVKDEVAAREVRSVFEKIAQGKPIDDLSDVFDEKTNFHILALSPNSARLAVRFFTSNSFGSLIRKIAMHYQDLRMEKQYATDADAISIWRLLNETVSPKSNDKAASPLMAGATLKAIITGSPYPASLYNAILIRIKAEKEINYYKAAIIKAYLLRNTNKFKEVLTMSLNEQSPNRAYILGRLFAVLEKAQHDANPGINATIKDRYFTSACATPASVFPVLLRLSQHYISKAEYGYVSDRKIADILEKLDINNHPFPSNLSLEEQGVFILGYYHQRNAFYQKNNKKSEEN